MSDSSMHDEEDFSSFYDHVNQTELLQMCRAKGWSVHPSTPRNVLSHMVVTNEVLDGYEVKPNPVDSWRLALIKFIDEYWQTLRPQLKGDECPAAYLHDPRPDTKQEDPSPCFRCSDVRVLACVKQNTGRTEQIIRNLRRK